MDKIKDIIMKQDFLIAGIVMGVFVIVGNRIVAKFVTDVTMQMFGHAVVIVIGAFAARMFYLSVQKYIK